MVVINQDRIVGFFAPSRYGKTTGIANMIQTIPLNIFIYDTNNEWKKRPELQAIAASRNNIVVFEPDKNKERDMNYLNTIIGMLRSKLTNFCLYIEDIEVFYNDEVASRKFFGEIKDLSERAGHQRIMLVYSAKEFKFIPRALISNTNLFYIGSFIEDDDIRRANRILKPNYDCTSLVKPTFIRVDRWEPDMASAKKEIIFRKVF